MMTKPEFVELFRYRLELLGSDTEAMYNYASLYYAASGLRSWMVKQLKLAGVIGSIRAEYNGLMDAYMPDYRFYLWHLDPTCQLCNTRIMTIEEATYDHIEPISLGGERAKTNVQLAHGHCNVLKGNKPIKSFQQFTELIKERV